MAEAFIYMFVVGAGTSLGVACVAFASWKVYQRSIRKTSKKRKGVAF
ncbi:hypothetical protein [Paraliobacillus sp. X-1268]|nr:hypothetical protein [Paraliobacillus sp. X-1268]